jgi:hypothetical protein
MACAICQSRRPRRFCPGVRGDICTLCCGTEREETVFCPLDCEYLREAHKHEKPASAQPSNVPNRDIRISEEFLQKNEELLAYLSQALLDSAVRISDAVDFDVREALEALARTYRALQNGVYYENRPNNHIAARICAATQNLIAEYRRVELEQWGIPKTRDADVLGALVFLQRLEVDRNNGRRRGRAFLAFLKKLGAGEEGRIAPARSSLVLP